MEGDQVNSNYTFPPGFRFHPSDEELIVYYLENKISSRPLPASIIAEIDLYKYNPWDLPKKALFGEDEWYFFSPRDRKYPNGARPNRAAASGYWKATGTDKPILASCGSKHLGVKKALVFYSGRPPKGVKTDWIMNEYRLVDTTTKTSRAKGSMRLDDWVLCRVRHKGYSSKNGRDNQENHSGQDMVADRSRGNPTYTNNQPDMIADYQYKDYRLLASILVGQPLLSTEAISSWSSAGNVGNSHTVYEDAFNFNKVNPQITDSSSCGYFDLLKGKSDEDNQNGNVISFHRKSNADNTLQNLPGKMVMNNGGVNFYNQNQSQDDILNESQRDPIVNFQELNELTFTGRFPQ